MRSRILGAVALAVLGACSSSGDSERSIEGNPITGGGNSSGNGSNGTEPGNGGNNGVSGSNNGGTDAGIDEIDGAQPLCGEVFVNAEPSIPDMLIVLDKSGSMVFPGCDKLDFITQLQLGCPNAPPPYDKAFDRWAPSVAAIKQLTGALESKIRFGLEIFPGKGAASASCVAGDVRVPVDLMTGGAIGSALDAEKADGNSTPTPGALATALQTLGSGLAGPDEKVAPKFVLLVTDGAPNCTADGMADDSITTPTRATTESYAAIDALAAQGIKTYVIGFGTDSGADLAAVLDEMAVHGKTGLTKHFPVGDAASLMQAFEKITGQVASCTYTLDKKPDDPTYVRVTLDGTDIPLSEQGWQLVNDTNIELRGDACKTLQDGTKEHKLSIKVECEPVMVQ